MCDVMPRVFRQGVVARTRVYHQRRHAGIPGHAWPDQAYVRATTILLWCFCNILDTASDPLFVLLTSSLRKPNCTFSNIMLS